MLIHADVKGLEVVTAAFLSQDPVLMEELWENYHNPKLEDMHSRNQRLFKLPDRTAAKRFVFKLLYGGTAFGYAVDPSYFHISRSKKFWEKRIDEFYKKYSRIAEWHEELVREVVNTGRLVLPTGREFAYPRKDVIDRLWFWRPKILNYPVQGTGADLVCIGRVAAWKRLRKAGLAVKWQSTVHDSIDIDTPLEMVYNVCRTVDNAIRDIPVNFERLFGVKFNLPVIAEIEYGPNLKDTTKYDANHSS